MYLPTVKPWDLCVAATESHCSTDSGLAHSEFRISSPGQIIQISVPCFWVFVFCKSVFLKNHYQNLLTASGESLQLCPVVVSVLDTELGGVYIARAPQEFFKEGRVAACCSTGPVTLSTLRPLHTASCRLDLQPGCGSCEIVHNRGIRR